MAKYQGRRMVKNDLIAEIGQGGGTEYTAGSNITIEDGVISAVDTTYTAGTGIDITSDVISVDNTIALKSDIIDVAANTTFTPTATLSNLQVGTVTYEVPQGGGTSYTFTNGLTESSGTVSWDYNGKFVYNDAAVESGKERNSSFELRSTESSGVKTFGKGNLAFGVSQGDKAEISAGKEDQTQSLTHKSGGNLAFGKAYHASEYNNGKIYSLGEGSLAFGLAGGTNYNDDGKIEADGSSSHSCCVAFGATKSGYIYSHGYASIAGGYTSGTSGTIESSGTASIAFGYAEYQADITASGVASIAIGQGVQATGNNAIALGYNTTASGSASEAHGVGTIASGNQQIVLGKYNVSDTSNLYSLIIGNGTADDARSNALTVSKDGIIECANIPAAPSADGTYKLTCTISSGVATYTWELQS